MIVVDRSNVKITFLMGAVILRLAMQDHHDFIVFDKKS